MGTTQFRRFTCFSVLMFKIQKIRKVEGNKLNISGHFFYKCRPIVISLYSLILHGFAGVMHSFKMI